MQHITQLPTLFMGFIFHRVALYIVSIYALYIVLFTNNKKLTELSKFTNKFFHVQLFYCALLSLNHNTVISCSVVVKSTERVGWVCIGGGGGCIIWWNFKNTTIVGSVFAVPFYTAL